MALTRWDPTREFTSLQKEMNRLFDELSPVRLAEIRLPENRLTPALELNETADAIDLKLEVPGMAPEDIEVEVAAASVTISGERKTEALGEAAGVKRSEFYYGKLYRKVSLPARVENTAATADYKDGILYLHLPKLEAEKRSVVKVNAK